MIIFNKGVIPETKDTPEAEFFFQMDHEAAPKEVQLVLKSKHTLSPFTTFVMMQTVLESLQSSALMEEEKNELT